MQESTLLRIAIVCTFLGISGLLILSMNNKLEEKPILSENDFALVKGEIARITQRESVTYIDVHTDNDVTVVLFKDYPVDLREGEYIEAEGKASKDQNGEIQFIANDVRVVK